MADQNDPYPDLNTPPNQPNPALNTHPNQPNQPNLNTNRENDRQ